MNKKRVFFVDDHPLVREWLTTLINDQGDLTVCGAAEDAPTARQKILAVKPDVALVDLALERGSGIELIKDLRRLCPDMRVVVLSMHDERLYAERCLRAGARGYVMKRESAKKVVAAIRGVLAGELFVSDHIRALMAEKFITNAPLADQSPVTLLSDRELEVFQLLGQGRETRQIAATLNVSMKTVQAHCAHIKAKLRLTNATELLREAVRWQEQGT